MKSKTLGLIVLTVLVGLQAGAEEQELPSAETVLDRFVEVTGGKQAWDALENRVAKANLDIVGQGVSMDLTIYSARPNKNYTLIESDMTGTIEKGTDGEVVWETSAIMGPQIKEGQERTDYLREVIFDRFVRWREVYESAECTDIEDVAGRPAYKVAIKPVEGREQTMYFDRDNGLLVKHAFVVETAAGTIPMEVLPEDYREVDGVTIAFGAKVVVMGQERKVVTKSVEHNVALPDDRFDLPEDIRARLAGDEVEAETAVE